MSRSISTAFLEYLQQDVRTLCTIWTVTRKDGQVFYFTDHDVDVLYGGQQFKSAVGYTVSAIDMSSDLSTSNLEIDCLIDNPAILESDVIAGRWNNAKVVLAQVNYMDTTMGVVNLFSGTLGQFSIGLGQLKSELRSLSQMLQQEMGELYSANCRATLGDSRCQVDLTPLTVAGAAVTGVVDPFNFDASSLTQTGPTSEFVDATGFLIPTQTPFQIPIVPPTGGSFVGNVSVLDITGAPFVEVSSNPVSGQYSVDGNGVYTFSGDNSGARAFINYNYEIGFFAYGYLQFTSGANAGYSMEIAGFSPGKVRLAMPMPFTPAVGDEFTIVAGCDRTIGTCASRFNNVIHFRGEPYIPGLDAIIKAQS